MAKYSMEFKMQIVQEYLNGEGGMDFLAKKYGFNGGTQVKNWINNYKEFGIEGLLRSRQNKTYSVQFKLDAIELYLTTEMSYREVANQFGMTNSSIIANWHRTYRENGVDRLSQPKGRQSKMPKKRKVSVSEISKKEVNTLEELEKENRQLKIELAYLKELRRLRLKEQQNNKHESFITSEKNSD